MQDQDAIAQPDQLDQLGADHQDGGALGRQLADERVDLGLGGHVDTARGLVEQQHARLECQEPGQHHLLLVATRERQHLLVERASPDVERVPQRLGVLTLPRRRGHEAGDGLLVDGGGVEVALDAIGDEGLRASLRGHQRDTQDWA